VFEVLFPESHLVDEDRIRTVDDFLSMVGVSALRSIRCSDIVGWIAVGPTACAIYPRSPLFEQMEEEN